MSQKIDLTTLVGNTETVEINTPGKWLIVASTSLVNGTSGNYAVYVEWIGKRSYCSGYHDVTKNANTYNVTSTNIIDVSNSYSNTIGYDNIVGSLRLVSAHWVAIKIGPAS